ncbi:hypothetical protein D3C72_2067030 [compost metagenome]
MGRLMTCSRPSIEARACAHCTITAGSCTMGISARLLMMVHAIRAPMVIWFSATNHAPMEISATLVSCWKAAVMFCDRAA